MLISLQRRQVATHFAPHFPSTTTEKEAERDRDRRDSTFHSLATHGTPTSLSINSRLALARAVGPIFNTFDVLLIDLECSSSLRLGHSACLSTVPLKSCADVDVDVEVDMDADADVVYDYIAPPFACYGQLWLPL